MGINISIIFPNTGCHGLEIIWANGARIEPGIDHLCHLPENHLDNLENSGLFLDHSSEKKRASHSHSGRVYGSEMEQPPWQNSSRCKGHWVPLGEGQISRILAKRLIFGRIFHANRKGGRFRVSREWLTTKKEKGSPIRAYFPSRMFLQVSY